LSAQPDEDDGKENGAADGTEDSALMARVQTGDEAAFGVLMERWEGPVKRLVARIVLNTGEAEELAQEAFVRVWQQREKFHAGAAFRPWLFSIAVNLARNRLRWWRRRPEVALEEWTEGAVLRETSAHTVERGERVQAVQVAVAGLPPDLRSALVLSQYEGLSHAEIGAALGCTPKAVEARIYRARDKLRKTLSGLGTA
jgi:RNA polymerase sigma-70 factor (ECF subfamily)